MTVQFDRIALIGIGLIGSSIAHDIKRLGLAKEVVIATRSADTLKRVYPSRLNARTAFGPASISPEMRRVKWTPRKG